MHGHSEIKFVPTLTLVLFVIAVVLPCSAAADSRAGPRFEATASILCAHRFEPGPIVNGHNRQPTPAEFEARIRQYTCSQKGCSSLPQGETPVIIAKNKPLTSDICL
jgi:hypothetical protein